MSWTQSYALADLQGRFAKLPHLLELHTAIRERILVAANTNYSVDFIGRATVTDGPYSAGVATVGIVAQGAIAALNASAVTYTTSDAIAIEGCPNPYSITAVTNDGAGLTISVDISPPLQANVASGAIVSDLPRILDYDRSSYGGPSPYLPTPAPSSKGFFGCFDDIMDELIPRFTNQNNEASWDGSTSLPDKWSEALALTEIGAVARVKMGTAKMLSAEWIRQQYLLLDILRWTSAQDTPFPNITANTERRAVATGATWAAAKSAADAAWYTEIAHDGDNTEELIGKRYTHGELSGATYTAIKRAQTFDYQFSELNGVSGLTFEADLYLRFEQPNESPSGTRTFDDFAAGYTEDKNGLAMTDTFSGASPQFTDIITLDEPPTWCDEPTVSGPSGHQSRGWQNPGDDPGDVEILIRVMKYDVANGFSKVT